MVTSRTIFAVIGESKPYLDLTHVPLWVVPAVNGLVEAIVPEDVPDAADGEEEGHDPGHPSERHDRRQESARAEDVAPAKISPLFSGDSSANDPQDEEDEEPNKFPAKG